MASPNSDAEGSRQEHTVMQGVRLGFGIGLGLFACIFLLPILFATSGLILWTGSGWWALLFIVAGILLIARASWRLGQE